MTDVQKYNRIVRSPIIVRIREFDKHMGRGAGETVAFLDGTPENVAAFISQIPTTYLLCDPEGTPIVKSQNHFFRAATGYEDSVNGEDFINSLKVLCNDGRWVRDFVEEPVYLSYERYYEIASAAFEQGIPPKVEVPEDVMVRARASGIILPTGELAKVEDENFTLSVSEDTKDGSFVPYIAR